MPLNIEALRTLVLSEGHRGQARAARRLGIGRSTLHQLITSEKKASSVTWRTVQRMAESAKLPFASLWSGPLPPEFTEREVDLDQFVPRGTSPSVVREQALTPYATGRLAPTDARGAFWAIERMNLALAQIAREARESLG